MKKLVRALFLTTLITPAAFAEQGFTNLEAKTPQEGYELAIKMSRVAIKLTQPSTEIRTEDRAKYERVAADLMAAAQVVATNHHTVAASNNYWWK